MVDLDEIKRRLLVLHLKILGGIVAAAVVVIVVVIVIRAYSP